MENVVQFTNSIGNSVLNFPRGLVQLSTNPIPTGWFVQKIDRTPTVFQPSYRKTVGFRGTNRHHNHVISDTKVGTGLVFAKLTVIPTIGYNIQRLERGWFSRNQPSAFLYEGWNTVDFP